MFFVVAKSANNIRYVKNATGMTVTANDLAIPIKENYFYLRNWSVSAFEKYGLNGNADGFLDEELKKAYKTFQHKEDKPCWVCLNHVAYSEKDSIGENVAPRYTPEGYVELIMCIDKNRAEQKRPYLEQDIKNGKVTDTSMGCLADYSVCTACGNIAHEAHEYCEHVITDMYGNRKKGQIITINGRKVIIGELYFGVNFVENSIIDDGAGADINAKIFEVAAHKNGSPVVVKDTMYYAIRELERKYGNLSVFSNIKKALEQK